jgi:hypothetical protein
MYCKSNPGHLKGMKPFCFLFTAIAFCTSSFAQTEGASKIYGYKQKVMPGTVRVDESGKEVQRKPTYNYFIYLASSCKVIPSEIWIHGKAYSPMVTAVSSTPVEYTNPTLGNRIPKVLVPKTTGKVLQLSPSTDAIAKPTQKGKVLSAKNELVIIYRWNNRLFYKTLAKLNELEPLGMQ